MNSESHNNDNDNNNDNSSINCNNNNIIKNSGDRSHIDGQTWYK